MLAYVLGRGRALGLAAAGRLHSLSGYHGGYVALWCALPALVLFAVWQLVEPVLLRNLVLGALPADLQALPEAQRGLIFNDIKNLVDGNIVAAIPTEAIIAAAERYGGLRALSHWLSAVAVLERSFVFREPLDQRLADLGGLELCIHRIHPGMAIDPLMRMFTALAVTMYGGIPGNLQEPATVGITSSLQLHCQTIRLEHRKP